MITTAVAFSEITPAESVPLMGYGDRTHGSEGVHDPLFAYAWWLEKPGMDPFVWIVLDLCLMSVISMRELTASIAKKTEMPGDRIHISATHTHSGPDVRFVSRSKEPWARRYYEKLVDGCAEAIRKARTQAVPCRITVRTAESDLGINRRDARATIENLRRKMAGHRQDYVKGKAKSLGDQCKSTFPQSLPARVFQYGSLSSDPRSIQVMQQCYQAVQNRMYYHSHHMLLCRWDYLSIWHRVSHHSNQ